MCPEMIIVCGRLFSEYVNETESTARFRSYLEAIMTIMKDLNCVNLRDHTEWIFVPSIEDAGQIKTMPAIPFAESLFQSLKTGPMRIKKLTLANNPCRISFLGKEIVICRYNFTMRLKQNHHLKIAAGQDRNRSTVEKPDSYKVAKTILRQGFLLPLPQIVQPIMWSYAVDTMNITPEPDILVLADDTEDFYHAMSLNELNGKETAGGSKVIHTVNPGSFAQDGSFAVIYPFTAKIEPSKI